MFVLLRVYFKQRVSKVLKKNCTESWSYESISPLTTIKGYEKLVLVKYCLVDLCLFRRIILLHLKVFTGASIHKYFSIVLARLLHEEAK